MRACVCVGVRSTSIGVRNLFFSPLLINSSECARQLSMQNRYFDQTFKEAKSIVAHRNANVESLSFSPGDVKFATGGSDGFVKIWDLEGAAVARAQVSGPAISGGRGVGRFVLGRPVGCWLGWVGFNSTY